MAEIDLPGMEHEAVVRAWRDPEYRQRLVDDPKTTLQTLLDETQPGVRLPGDLEVTAVAEDTRHYFLVVPPVPSGLDAANASGEELDGILFRGTGMTGCVTRTHTPMS